MGRGRPPSSSLRETNKLQKPKRHGMESAKSRCLVLHFV